MTPRLVAFAAIALLGLALNCALGWGVWRVVQWMVWMMGAGQ